VQPRSTSAAACSAAIITGEASACLQLGQAWTWPTQCKNQRALCTSLLRLESVSLLTTMRNVGASLEGGSLVPRNNRPLHCLGLHMHRTSLSLLLLLSVESTCGQGTCVILVGMAASLTRVQLQRRGSNTPFSAWLQSHACRPPCALRGAPAARPRRCPSQSIEKV
jgi:hypothetical protein